MKPIAIIGCGSHTRSSLNLLTPVFDKKLISIYDNSFQKNREEFVHEIPLVGNIQDIPENHNIFLSIGDNTQRAELYQKFETRIIKKNLIHATSYIEKFVTLGHANQILANTYINSYVKMGDNNIINTAAVLEHEVVVGNHNHISVGAIICGRATIGNHCFIGANSTVIDKISICDNVTIGAGAVVVANITKSGTYVGVPAKRIV